MKSLYFIKTRLTSNVDGIKKMLLYFPGKYPVRKGAGIKCFFYLCFLKSSLYLHRFNGRVAQLDRASAF